MIDFAKTVLERQEQADLSQEKAALIQAQIIIGSILLSVAIADQIVVEKHQGKITCQSELNQGTEFAIALPTLRQSYFGAAQCKSVITAGIALPISHP